MLEHWDVADPTENQSDPAALLDAAAAQLAELARRMSDPDITREEFEVALGEAEAAVVRAFGPRPRAKPGEGGMWKMLDYLREHPNEWIWGDELKAIARIGEWARRIRQLRVEHGWDIQEEGRKYRLNSKKRNEEEAALWQLMNAIRRRPGSARERIAALLDARVGDVLTRDDLDYVAKIKEGSRRWRELRDEEGWPIESHIDDPRLRPGQYRLVSSDPKDRVDPRQRLYAEYTRARIFERDNHTCHECGRNREAAERAGDRRFYLELHHRTAVAEQLDALPASELNNANNLITLCHDDHLRLTTEFQRKRRRERRQT